MRRNVSSLRKAYTVVETVAALGALLAAAVVVAQLGVQSLAERQRAVQRLAAIEAVANILETARTVPWERLSADWAAEVRLPESLADRLANAKLSVAVQTVPDRSGLKRVDVELTWRHGNDIPAKPVRMSALFARRGEGDDR